MTARIRILLRPLVDRFCRALLPVLLTLLAYAAPLSCAHAAEPAAGDGPLPSPYAIEIPRWFTESLLDLRDDLADAAREKKRLLLYFGQDGCPYCTALMKVNSAV